MARATKKQKKQITKQILGKKDKFSQKNQPKGSKKQNQPKWRKFGLLQAMQKNSAKNKKQKKIKSKVPKAIF